MATNNKKVIKAGTGYIIGNYLLKGITFLSAPIFSRLLTPEDFGEVGAYLSIESILYIVVGLALHSSLNKAKYKYGEKLNEYASSLVLLMLVCTAVWFVLANIFYELYKEPFGFSREIANILILNCLASALWQFYSCYISIDYGYKKFVAISSINAISNLVLSTVLILTVFRDNRIDGRIIGTVTPLVLIGIYIVILFFKKAKPRFVKEYWLYGIRYSLPIIPHGIAQVILGSFDRLMIRGMVGSLESGIYNFASTVLLIFRVAVSSLENVWKPWIFEKLEEKDYESIKKQGGRFAFGMALFLCLLVMVSPEVIMILVDKSYWGSADCVIPVLIGGYFAFVYTLPAMVEFFYEKTRLIAVGTVSAAIINIVLNYVCIKQWGYIAAAYTTLATYLLYFIFHYVLAKRIVGRSLYSTKQLVIIFIGIFFVGAVALLLKDCWYIRWALALGMGLGGIIWADKTFRVFEMIRKKLGKEQ